MSAPLHDRDRDVVKSKFVICQLTHYGGEAIDRFLFVGR